MFQHRSRSLLALFAAAITIIISQAARADVLFEGWFEIFKGTKKIGFLVERYEFTNKQFKATKYLKTNADGGSITESLKAFSGADLAPVSYAYTNKTGDDIKIVDAHFKGDLMTLDLFDGHQKTKQTKRIKKGTLLSEFLIYLILSQKDGIKVGNNYGYSAIAEEDGSVATGSSFVKDEETVKGKKVFRLLNDFKGQKYFTWYTSKGEPVLNRSPEANMEVRAADSMEEATQGLIVKPQDLKLLFGNVPGEKAASPTGDNADDKAMDAKKKKLFEKHQVRPGKDAGVPGGQGIEIKPPPPAPNAD